jgi:hypothetical protein
MNITARTMQPERNLEGGSRRAFASHLTIDVSGPPRRPAFDLRAEGGDHETR